jgi:hypothetical protein
MYFLSLISCGVVPHLRRYDATVTALADGSSVAAVPSCSSSGRHNRQRVSARQYPRDDFFLSRTLRTMGFANFQPILLSPKQLRVCAFALSTG